MATTRLVCVKNLVLKADVGESVAMPEALELGADACGLETRPVSSVDGRIGAEGAPEAAPLRRDESSCRCRFKPKCPIDRDQAVVVRGELVDIDGRARRIQLYSPDASSRVTDPATPRTESPAADRSTSCANASLALPRRPRLRSPRSASQRGTATDATRPHDAAAWSAPHARPGHRERVPNRHAVSTLMPRPSPRPVASSTRPTGSFSSRRRRSPRRRTGRVRTRSRRVPGHREERRARIVRTTRCGHGRYSNVADRSARPRPGRSTSAGSIPVERGDGRELAQLPSQPEHVDAVIRHAGRLARAGGRSSRAARRRATARADRRV